MTAAEYTARDPRFTVAEQLSRVCVYVGPKAVTSIAWASDDEKQTAIRNDRVMRGNSRQSWAVL